MDQDSLQLTAVSTSSSRESVTKRLYTIPELVRLTGLTRKQITHWTEIGLLTATFHDPQAGVGQPASFYTALEAIKVLVASELRRSGFSPRQLQQVARNLQEHGIELYDADAYLLTDGYSVYYAFSDTEVVDILKHHRQMLMLVPIHEQIAKLKEVA